jgi:hypothetical protein
VARRSSRVLAFGLVLFLLGAGNWAMGITKMAQYKERQKEAMRIGGETVTAPFRGSASILEERTDAHELYEESVARYRYYKLVRRGGRFFMVIGALLVFGALLRRMTVPSSAGPPAAQSHLQL